MEAELSTGDRALPDGDAPRWRPMGGPASLPFWLGCGALSLFIAASGAWGVVATAAQPPATDEPLQERPAEVQPAVQADAAQADAAQQPQAVDAYEEAEQAEVPAEVAVAEEVQVVQGVVEEGLLWIDAPEDPQILLLKKYAAVNAALARRVCELSDEQERQLSQIDRAWLQRQIDETADNPIKRAAAAFGGFLLLKKQPPVRRAPRQPYQIVEAVRELIDDQINSILEPEQLAHYQKEIDARNQFRRESMAGVIVAILDHRLYLTDAQRTALQPKIAHSLTTDYYWQFYFQNTEYVPTIPEDVLAGVLSPDQIQYFKGMQLWNYKLTELELQLVGQEQQVVIER